MFKPKLFDDDISPACGYCLHGSRSTDGTAILCQKRGVVAPDYNCRKFSYDPLKRVPRRQPGLPEFDPSDFKL